METSLRFDVTGEQSVTVTAVPDDGYFFVNWSDGVTSRTRTDSNFKQNLDVTAVFSRASVEIAGEGSGLLGMNYTFTARLSGQYAKAENLHWYVNGVESKEAAGRTSRLLHRGPAAGQPDVYRVRRCHLQRQPGGQQHPDRLL